MLKKYNVCMLQIINIYVVLHETLDNGGTYEAFPWNIR